MKAIFFEVCGDPHASPHTILFYCESLTGLTLLRHFFWNSPFHIPLFFPNSGSPPLHFPPDHICLGYFHRAFFTNPRCFWTDFLLFPLSLFFYRPPALIGAFVPISLPPRPLFLPFPVVPSLFFSHSCNPPNTDPFSFPRPTSHWSYFLLTPPSRCCPSARPFLLSNAPRVCTAPFSPL